MRGPRKFYSHLKALLSRLLHWCNWLVQLQEQLRAGILRPKVLPEKTLMRRVRRTAQQSTLRYIFAYNFLVLYSILFAQHYIFSLCFSRYWGAGLNFALGAHGRRVFLWVRHDTVLFNVWRIVCCFILCFCCCTQLFSSFCFF